jgi:hypothetical protein
MPSNMQPNIGTSSSSFEHACTEHLQYNEQEVPRGGLGEGDEEGLQVMLGADTMACLMMLGGEEAGEGEYEREGRENGQDEEETREMFDLLLGSDTMACLLGMGEEGCLGEEQPIRHINSAHTADIEQTGYCNIGLDSLGRGGEEAQQIIEEKREEEEEKSREEEKEEEKEKREEEGRKGNRCGEIERIEPEITRTQNDTEGDMSESTRPKEIHSSPAGHRESHSSPAGHRESHSSPTGHRESYSSPAGHRESYSSPAGHREDCDETSRDVSSPSPPPPAASFFIQTAPPLERGSSASPFPGILRMNSVRVPSLLSIVTPNKRKPHLRRIRPTFVSPLPK